MKVIDILEILSDSVEVNIYDEDLTLIARYDGKDSIGEDINDKTIIGIFPKDRGIINIMI